MGLVENMSYVACPDCGKKIYLFGQGKTAQALRRTICLCWQKCLLIPFWHP